MTKKLSIDPDVSYVIGLYRCNLSGRNLCVHSTSRELIERFVRIAVMKLGTRMDAITITEENDETVCEIRNSRLKTLLDKALDERDRIFKYKNEYSGSYFAGIYDCKGGADRRGVFLRGVNAYDKILLERLGFHTASNTGRCYVKSSMDFVMFIAPFSIKAQEINQQSNKKT